MGWGGDAVVVAQCECVACEATRVSAAPALLGLVVSCCVLDVVGRGRRSNLWPSVEVDGGPCVGDELALVAAEGCDCACARCSSRASLATTSVVVVVEFVGLVVEDSGARGGSSGTATMRS